MTAAQWSFTVEFPSPLKGAEIIAAVMAVIKQGGEAYQTAFHCQPPLGTDDARHTLGQSSNVHFQHLLVGGEADMTLLPCASYRRVTVQSHDWPEVWTAHQRWQPKRARAYGERFARHLRHECERLCRLQPELVH